MSRPYKREMNTYIRNRRKTKIIEQTAFLFEATLLTRHGRGEMRRGKTQKQKCAKKDTVS